MTAQTARSKVLEWCLVGSHLPSFKAAAADSASRAGELSPPAPDAKSPLSPEAKAPASASAPA